MPTIIRRAVRALILDPGSQRVLLIRAQVPDGNRDLWMTPGGGVEDGESDLDALKREIWEETGHRLPGAPRPIWTRSHVYHFNGQDIDQHEQYFYLPTPFFEPTSEHNPADAEMMVFREFRWWHLGDIDESDEVFVPQRMPWGLREVLRAGLPAEAFDIDYGATQ